MRENNRNSIEKCRKKISQFTTMNVIDGQAGLINYSSLIFYSLTIDNILNIIVLLILAGVTIATLTGENGILTRAQQAKEKTELANQEEELKLSKIELQMNADRNELTLTNGNILFEDKNGDFAVIPKGFIVSKYEDEMIVENGLVIYQIDNSENIQWLEENRQEIQGKYNQFVWVPVEVDEEFKRYQSYQNGNLQNIDNYYEPALKESQYQNEATEFNKMKESVLRYKGFYVARYEASKDDINIDKAASKRGKNVWNDITWGNSMTDIGTEGAVAKSQNMYTDYKVYGVHSTLIYGIQWDAIMSWIEPKYKNEDTKDQLYENKSFVANSENMGNYYDNDTTNNPMLTGSDIKYKVKNIYDLAGNVSEWTMESKDNSQRVGRGSNYNSLGANGPASNRYGGEPTHHDVNLGFRVTLYL